MRQADGPDDWYEDRDESDDYRSASDVRDCLDCGTCSSCIERTMAYFEQQASLESYIVILEPGVYVVDVEGDPGRTLVKESATRFATYSDAAGALAEARAFRPFRNAVIQPVPS